MHEDIIFKTNVRAWKKTSQNINEIKLVVKQDKKNIKKNIKNKAQYDIVTNNIMSPIVLSFYHEVLMIMLRA